MANNTIQPNGAKQSLCSERVQPYKVNSHPDHTMTYTYNARYAPPITQEGFSCSGPSDEDFYIDLDNDPSSRYSRADPSYIYYLLTYTEPSRPVKSTDGSLAKVQPPIHKDKSAGWYCAQLMHYGMKGLKTKSAAKKALLAAFGEVGLKVPERIVKLKKLMQEEYAEANEKAWKSKVEMENSETNRNDKGKGKGPAPAKRKLATPEDGGEDDETSSVAPPKKTKPAPMKNSSSQKKSKGPKRANASDKLIKVGGIMV